MSKPRETNLIDGKLPGQPPAPLPLVGEQRVETYEIEGPDGRIVEVRHNVDTGAFEYTETDRTALRSQQQ